jgi:hypothetical protein
MAASVGDVSATDYSRTDAVTLRMLAVYCSSFQTFILAPPFHFACHAPFYIKKASSTVLTGNNWPACLD